MKKISIALTSIFFVLASAFAQQAGPELLKNKENFSKSDLFEPETVFMNLDANLAAVKAYEASPESYKDNELLPVAICYMTLRDIDKTKSLLEKFMKASPENLRAIRTYGTIMLFSGNYDEAFTYYKKAIEKGDNESLKSIASAYIYAGNDPKSKVSIGDMAPYIPQLKEIAKDDLQTANMIFIYAVRDEKKRDVALIKQIVESMNIKKAMEGASADAFATALNIYSTEKSAWTPASLVIPARGALLGGHWGPAKEIYEEILASDPKNTEALRGKAIVEYNLGGIMEAVEILEKALKLGDEKAISDMMELVIVTSKVNKATSEKIYSRLKSNFPKGKYNLQTRLAMLEYSINSEASSDVFFLALEGDEAKEFFNIPQVVAAIEKGLEKYEGDMRSFSLKKRLEEVKK